MRPSILIALLALLLAGLVVYGGMHRAPAPVPTPTYPPGREPMTLPADYRDTFDLYAMVDRSDAVTRKIYISPAAVEAVRGGEALPERTQIVIEAYAAARDANGALQRDDQGHLVPGTFDPEVHVAELRSIWQIEDLASSSHVGDWNFAAFDFTSGAPNREALADCFSCHDGASRSGFMFTRPELDRYAETGTPQYRYCPLPARVPCSR